MTWQHAYLLGVASPLALGAFLWVAVYWPELRHRRRLLKAQRKARALRLARLDG